MWGSEDSFGDLAVSSLDLEVDSLTVPAAPPTLG